MIAEESTAWPKVSHPVADGGLGFTHKWNMGWMHDTLDYMGRDYLYRKWHQNQLSFSHDVCFFRTFYPAVVPRRGRPWQTIADRPHAGRLSGANLPACGPCILYQMTHPGGKLMFMGGEFGQFIEWRFYEQLEWFLLEYDNHQLLQDFVRDLNHYLPGPAGALAAG